MKLFRPFLFLMLSLFVPLVFSGCDEQLLTALRQRLEQLKAEGKAPPTAEEALKILSNLQAENPNSEQLFDNSYLQSALNERFPATLETCPYLLEGAPRGLACLHCMQAEAQGQGRVISTLLERSCLKNIAINFLVDGTFSFDEAYLFEQVTRLTQNGRRLFLHLYLTNGATQRDWRKTEIDAFGTKVPPEEFRWQIKHDTAMRQRFREIVRRILPVIRYAQSRGGIVSLIPALEDNLDKESFRALLSLLLEELPGDLYVAIGRNPCPGCYSGNDTDIPLGLFEETHTSNTDFTTKDGLVTNDGRDYIFEAEDKQNQILDLSSLANVRDKAQLNNNLFILWSAPRQGLPGATDSNRQVLHPSKRTFKFPSLEERAALIQFLRKGL